ncbi:MAG: hypothetical protein P8H05_00515 [Schleiferiaceae bacterium]|nr:hypothetical protein [Schleiferiaceae bacterium]
MKYYFIFFVCLILGSDLVAQAQNEALFQNRTSNGLKDGFWRVKHKGTSINRYTGEFQMGVPKGVFKHYYSKGNIRSVMSFKGLAGECYVKNYNRKEKLISEGKYLSENVKDSIWKIYNENGRIIISETWEKGSLEGLYQTYYSNGNVVESGIMNNAKKDGQWIRWSENGEKIRVSNYSDNILNGKWIDYDVDGRVKMLGAYLNGYRDGKWVFYNFGKLKKSIIFQKGREINITEY